MPFNQTQHEALYLTDERAYYKPFRYPQFYDMATTHQELNWNRKHIKTLNEDLSDFEAMSAEERAPLEAMLLYFTMVDVDVGASYFKNLGRFYNHPEILMWIARVIDREATHTDCYDMLPEQFGLRPERYSEILEIEAIKDQHIYMSAKGHTGELWDRMSTLVKHIAGEGIGIYGVFLPLVNYSLYGRMKSVGLEIVSWSARDENEHVVGLSELFNIEAKENSEEYTEAMRETLRVMLQICVENTDKVIDYFYSLGIIKHLTADQVKTSLRQIANARSEHIGLGILYPDVVDIAPIEAMQMLFTGSEMANFFETSNTAYGFYSGEWEYPKEGEVIPDWELADNLLNG